MRNILRLLWNWVVVWLLWPAWLPMAWVIMVLRIGTGENGTVNWHWHVCRCAAVVAFGYTDPK